MARDQDSNRMVANLAVLVAFLVILGNLSNSPGHGMGPPILSWAFLAGNPILLVPVLTLALAASFWWVVEREPLSRSVAVQYEPPPDLSPAESSALLEDSVKARSIIGSLVDLAVRGYLAIEETDGGDSSRNRYVFHNLRKPNWANDLAPHERDLMEHIFEYGEQPSLGVLWHGLPEYLPQIKQHIFSSLDAKKMYRLSPVWSSTLLLLAGSGTLLLLWLLATALDFKLTDYSILNPVCFGLAMLTIFFFSRKVTLKSALGKERWRQVKGFQEFMSRVDADRLKLMPADTFEKFLPYAISLGVESEWTTRFKGMLTRPLSWYTGAVADFLSALDDSP